MTNTGASNLAKQVGTPISFDDITYAPYFYYNSLAGVQHFVWYKDATSIDSILKLVYEYGLKGLGVWNIMYFSLRIWLIINSQYDIESVLNNPTIE
jgi:spore germination protein